MGGNLQRLVIAGGLGAGLGLALRFGLPLQADEKSTPPSMQDPPAAVPPEVSPTAPSLDAIVEQSGSAFRISVVHYLRRADLSDVQALLLSGAPGVSNYYTQKLIYLRAVELNAAAFVRWLESQDSEAKWVSVSWAYKLWAQIDGKSAHAACPDAKTRKLIIGEIAKTDSELADEMQMNEAPENRDPKELERKRIENMTVAELASALDKTVESRVNKEQRSRLSQLLSSWAKKDPNGAWEWLRNQTDLPDRNRLSLMVVGTIAETNPDAAQARLELLPINAGRFKSEGRILTKLAARDIEGAVASIATETNSARRAYLFSRIAKVLATTDPERLLQLVSAHQIPLHGENVGKWSMDLPGIGWGTSSGDGLSKWVNSSAKALAIEHPAKALAQVALIGGDYEPIASQWAQTAPREAAEWLTSVPGDSEFAISSLFRVLSTWATNDPQAAVAFLSEKNLEPAYAQNVGEAWAKADPEAAMSWMQNWPGDVDSAMRRASTDWVRRDPEAASAWIGEMAPGNRRDNAVVGMIEAFVTGFPPRTDTEFLDEWVETIDTPELRDKWRKKLRQ